MSDLFEKADALIKRAAGAPKPVFRPVDYAYRYGQLVGGIRVLEVYLAHPGLLEGEVRKLVELEREISAEIDEQNRTNMEALKL